MPISALDGCPAEHWAEVKAIITEAIESIVDPKFAVKLVSDADDIGIIQKRIVQNVYSSDIVVCDVSGKNPNVMFELGLRLAFDRPIVIVKDDKTDYAFDTGIIEHVGYPRDLRFGRVVEFKKTLCTKVSGTHKAAAGKPDHSPFLKNFGKFTVAHLDETTVTPDRLVLEVMEELRLDMRRIRRRLDSPELPGSRGGPLPEFFGSLAAFTSSYMQSEKLSDLKGLLGNEQFYEAAEKYCNAPRYFPARPPFVEAVDTFLRGQVEPIKP
jgi:hypothetical protein